MKQQIDPEKINVILATDCGSTTTKAILIQKVDGQFRQTHRGEAPSTVEEPFADVTVGVVNSVQEVAELAGRRLIADGRIIQPATETEGCDIYISTSSAGGGLQMMVAGVIKEMTAASAKRAALGAGAIVMDTIASNDKRQPHEQIQRIRDLRPDMMLLSGGTDGGTLTHVMKIAELVAPAKPQPRFGSQYLLPIIFAGNQDAAPKIQELFGNEEFDLTIVENLRPVMERENLGPARDAIHDLFLEHVMAHAPGYNRLIEWADADIMPTPGAVGNILQTIAREQKINVVGVDIGGATTDIFSVFDETFNRTVSANLGMSYSISNVCAEAGMPSVLRWVHLDMDEKDVRNRVKNKMIRPTTIPQSREALIFEQAVAREALRLAYQQHKEFATTLKGVQQQRSVGDTFSQEVGGQTIVNNMKLNLLVASGGVLSHAPRMHQTAMLLIDSFQPEGVTTLAKDSIFMMPHLGVLSQVHPKAAMEVFEKDCLIYLGTVVAPAGHGKPGKACFSYTVKGGGLDESGTVAYGELKLLALGLGETAEITVEPEKAFDTGAGPGRKITRKVRGGTVGLILDGRGRPLSLPDDPAQCRSSIANWVDALTLYPPAEAAPPPPPPEPAAKSATGNGGNGGGEKGHAYTPGLKVTARDTIRLRRVLPIPGEVLVQVGDTVEARQVVAETHMPGDIFPINLSNLLSMPPADVPEVLLVKEGDTVKKGDVLARTKGIFGMFKSEYKSKEAGTVETISDITGQVIIRGAPHPVNVVGFLPGKVVEVIEGQGIVIESDVTYVQGIFGIGGEAFGRIRMACPSPKDTVTAEHILPDMKDCVIVGGARMTAEAVKKAGKIGAAGIISGGIDDQDLKDFLGYDLGVAITGSEKMGLTLIITEGFGDIAMADRTFNLLKSREGADASINGATQIRAGVMRPMVIVPVDETVSASSESDRVAGVLDIGYPVRVIRDPYFGLIGKVHRLPPEPRVLESGSKTRVLEVELDSGEPITIPRANVELIEE